MATAITITDYQAACAACADAIRSNDWVTAATECAVAEAINAGLDVEGEADGVKARRRETLVGLRQAIDAVQSAVNRGTPKNRRAVLRVGFGR